MPIPTYADLEPRAVAWAAARGLVDADGTPLKATPMAQHRKTLEEIGEAAEALEVWRKYEPVTDKSIAKYFKQKELALEFGDILVTLVIQAAMHGRTLEQCKVEAGRAQGKPFTWDYVGKWAEGLSESVDNPKSMFRFDIPTEVGAIALCVEDIARIELSLMGSECLALALEKIAGRTGEVVDGVFVKAGV